MDKLLRAEYYIEHLTNGECDRAWKTTSRDEGIRLTEKLNQSYPRQYRLVKELTYEVVA